MPQRGGSDRLFRKPSSLRWPFSRPPELGSRRAHPGGAVGAALALLLCPAPASWAGSPHALPPSSRPVHLFRKAGLAEERAAEKGQPGCSQTWAGGRPGGGRAPSFLVTLLGSSFFGPRGLWGPGGGGGPPLQWALPCPAHPLSRHPPPRGRHTGLWSGGFLQAQLSLALGQASHLPESTHKSVHDTCILPDLSGSLVEPVSQLGKLRPWKLEPPQGTWCFKGRADLLML